MDNIPGNRCSPGGEGADQPSRSLCPDDRLPHRMPNKDLTPDQRQAKRALKKELKQKRKRSRLEARLRHAVSRRDEKVEAETLELLGEGRVALMEVDHQEKEARKFLSKLYRQVKDHHRNQRQCFEPAITGRAIKELQTNQGVNLLRHMKKGTQDLPMFDNPDALWGYTRQKFHQRSLLLYMSLSKLAQHSFEKLTKEDADRRRNAWDALINAKSICSIGCGPGCDAAGVLAFLRQYAQANAEEKPLLSSVVLLDWAVVQWKTVLDALHPILEPRWVRHLQCEQCDITESIVDHNNNARAHEMLKNSDVDFYLFSYVLTETRGKWEVFMRELVREAKPNALFYFAEPTPWQLHQVRLLLPDLDYIWLDSSMNQLPNLQALEARLGPGVLLARKK